MCARPFFLCEANKAIKRERDKRDRHEIEHKREKGCAHAASTRAARLLPPFGTKTFIYFPLARQQKGAATSHFYGWAHARTNLFVSLAQKGFFTPAVLEGCLPRKVQWPEKSRRLNNLCVCYYAQEQQKRLQEYHHLMWNLGREYWYRISWNQNLLSHISNFSNFWLIFNLTLEKISVGV